MYACMRACVCTYVWKRTTNQIMETGEELQTSKGKTKKQCTKNANKLNNPQIGHALSKSLKHDSVTLDFSLLLKIISTILFNIQKFVPKFKSLF